MAKFTLAQLLEKAEEVGKDLKKASTYYFNRGHHSYQPPVTGEFTDTLMELIFNAEAIQNHVRHIKNYAAKAEECYNELITIKGENNLPILNVSDRPKVKCIVDLLKSIIKD